MLNIVNNSLVDNDSTKILIQSPLNLPDHYGVFEKRIYKLRDILILPRNGIYIKDNFVFLINFGSINRFFNWSSAPIEILKSHFDTKIDSKYENVLHLPDTGFYHFITEVFPALLWHIEAKIPTVIVIDKNSAPYCIQLINIVIRTYKVSFFQTLTVDRPYRCKSAYLHNITQSSGRPFQSDLKIIDKYFGIESDLIKTFPTSIDYDRIYISRGQYGRRSMRNDSIISEFLNQIGFTTLRLETLDVKTQISILSNSSIIIAPHGAGLTHLVWSRPTTVIEIFPPKLSNDCYEILCTYYDISYHKVINKAYYEVNSNLAFDQTNEFLSDLQTLI